MMFRTISRQTAQAIALFILLAATPMIAAENAKPNLESSKLGSTRNVHAFGTTLLCGQPSAEDLAAAKKLGIKTVITLREEGEIDWDEAATVPNLGLGFHRIGFLAADTLTDDVFDSTRKVLQDSQQEPVLLHCGSANRVGAVWLAHRVLDHGITIDQAVTEAGEVGLRNAAYGGKALDYIKRKQAEPADR